MANELRIKKKKKKKIQSIPGGNVKILGGYNIGHSKQKTVYVHVSYSEHVRYRAISLYSTMYTVQTSNTTCPHTSCKVH
jgi:hypothetical protein